MSAASRRSLRLLLVVACAVLVFAVGVGQAVAGTAVFSNPSPPPNTTVASSSFTASVDYDDVSALKRAWAKVDGQYVTPVTITVDASDNTKGTVSFPVSDVADGSHTLEVLIYNASYKMSTYSWSIRVDTSSPPSLSNPTPEPESTVSTQTPTVSVLVSGPVASYQLYIDGSPIPSTLASGLLFGEPTSDLTNDTTHTVRAEATSLSGLTATLDWSFFVQIHPKMTDTIGTACTSCHYHSKMPAEHQMDNCDGCHGEGSPVGHGGLDPSVYEEGQPEHPSSWLTDAGLDCIDCHNPSYPMVPQVHSAPPDDPYHDTTAADCDECHQRSLTVEHFYRGNGLTCETCHMSADSRVITAIAAGDTNCSSCHVFDSTDHPYVPSAHVSGIDSQSTSGSYPSGTWGPYVCTTCHQQELGPEHERVSSSSQPSGCSACHPSPRDTLDPWNKGCVEGGCHAPASPQEQHALTVTAHDVTTEPLNAKCAGSGCHNETDLGELHLARGCTVCHSNTSVPSTKVCEECHPDKVDSSGNVVDHGYDAAMHTASVGADIFSGGISGSAFTAMYNDGTGAQYWIASPQTFGNLTCEQCHSMDLYTEHDKASSAGPGGCDVCHGGSNPPADSITTWGGTCSEGDCHTGSVHASMDAKHGLSTTTELDNSCSYCHIWGGDGTDMAAAHNDYWKYQQDGRAKYTNLYPTALPQNGCAISTCHSGNATVPSGPKNCDTCHESLSPTWPHP